ncbi:MAG: energy-coupling factor transporter transmembrane protein EcfT [Richelia sp. RM2_1_2]|nr:energy-coupling factor transporter transmembrane protein EcfT [Richelia sp. SM1_7_0]NJN12460.1 energy-coupling factor transporter transmembrane protein EcfT [Richelia sp. RM1_1_1]NJO29676.1 energy-coupling factor transporter transmembrane protein EcfT [Richelia sp. SL_2_1]NJO63092.1 energy-coupling factor transporter transmembrane protein EcfT [Richelia sp. RM2_1_2]
MDLLRSLPLGLYLEQPITWLHKLDPRVKLIWLMSFLTTYIFANTLWRIMLAALLIFITLISGIPRRVWQKQMGYLLSICFLVLVIASLSPDGMGIDYQPRLPENQQIVNKPSNSDSTTNPILSIFNPENSQEYNYVLFAKGPIRITRHSFDLALRLSSIFFTVLYSTTLYLLTTAPEEITAGIETLMRPLRRFKVPVTEIALTLTLSLRFIPLVLEEIQNLVRSVMTRAINWKKLGLKGAVKVWMTIAERLLQNLLLRAEQMANGIVVRGFIGPNKHRVQWHNLRLKSFDWLAILGLILFWGVRFTIGNEVN